MPRNPSMAARHRRACTAAGLCSLAVFAVVLLAYWFSLTDMGESLSTLVKSGSKSASQDMLHDQPDGWHFEVDTVVGFFLQDSPGTNPGTTDAMKVNFGLIEQEYDTDKLLPANGKDLTQWERFAFKLKVMNQKAANDVSYRLLYLGRHGNGYHNVGSSFYGSEAWDCYYSTLHSDPHVPSIQFFDAHLTLLGKHQADLASQFWRHLITTQRIPVAETYYCSPHVRAIQTADHTFSPLTLPANQPFDPLIKELLREGHGIHTCDSRSTKTYISSNYPHFRIEPGFTETDELYSPTYREPPGPHTARMLQLLDDVFEHDNSTYISMTSHSGSIAAILRGINHRSFLLPTGGIIPVLVKAKKVPGKRPDDKSGHEGWETKPDCVEDPLKAGVPGYKDIADYIEREIDGKVPEDANVNDTHGVGVRKSEKARGKERLV